MDAVKKVRALGFRVSAVSASRNRLMKRNSSPRLNTATASYPVAPTAVLGSLAYRLDKCSVALEALEDEIHHQEASVLFNVNVESRVIDVRNFLHEALCAVSRYRASDIEEANYQHMLLQPHLPFILENPSTCQFVLKGLLGDRLLDATSG